MASHTDETPGPSTDCLTDEQNRNTAKIHCQYCPSIILLPGKGELVTDMSVDIPQVQWLYKILSYALVLADALQEVRATGRTVSYRFDHALLACRGSVYV